MRWEAASLSVTSPASRSRSSSASRDSTVGTAGVVGNGGAATLEGVVPGLARWYVTVSTLGPRPLKPISMQIAPTMRRTVPTAKLTKSQIGNPNNQNGETKALKESASSRVPNRCPRLDYGRPSHRREVPRVTGELLSGLGLASGSIRLDGDRRGVCHLVCGLRDHSSLLGGDHRSI
jgi:hypothetical protein